MVEGSVGVGGTVHGATGPASPWDPTAARPVQGLDQLVLVLDAVHAIAKLVQVDPHAPGQDARLSPPGFASADFVLGLLAHLVDGGRASMHPEHERALLRRDEPGPGRCGAELLVGMEWISFFLR